jgi:hypothetical protein
LALLGLAAAGCTTTGTTGSLRPAANATVAFESIDGPPAAVFRRLVQKLNEEAQARQVPIVSREQRAPYRVRGYVAIGIEKKRKRTVLSWVWDVYDASERRAVRLSGEETLAAADRDAWAGADDEALGRIARSGIEQLAAYLRTPPPASASPAPVEQSDDRGYTVAARDDFRPEASGIFRLFRSEPAGSAAADSAPASGAASSAEGIPVPRRRPGLTQQSRDRVAATASQS